MQALLFRYVRKLSLKDEKLDFIPRAIRFSCAVLYKRKTDYEAEKDNDIIENETFKEATVINNGAYTIHIESLHGMFYKGYNEIRLTVKKRDSRTTCFILYIFTHPNRSKHQNQLLSPSIRHDISGTGKLFHRIQCIYRRN